MVGAESVVPFNGSTERALKGDLAAERLDLAFVPFNGSTERALKAYSSADMLSPSVVPFNGSTERALKGKRTTREIALSCRSIQRLNRESTERAGGGIGECHSAMFHSTAQQREH